MTRHRWAEPVRFDHKSERECRNNCGILKVTRHESEGGKDIHFIEFYRGLDKIECIGTPPCTGRAKLAAATYDARNYPL